VEKLMLCMGAWLVLGKLVLGKFKSIVALGFVR